MSKNLKKFANPKFLRTCDLALTRRFLSRYELKGFDVASLDTDEEEARDLLRALFHGPEQSYPASLKIAIHRIAELGTTQGMRLLLERARARDIQIAVPTSAAVPKKKARSKDAQEELPKPDPKQLALICFLDYPHVFEDAAGLMAIESKVTLSEYCGVDSETSPQLNEKTKSAFEEAVGKFLATEFQGNYCRVEWFEDDGEINVLVVHGSEHVIELIIEGKAEKRIEFQPAAVAVLRYNPAPSRLKIGGIAKTHRSPFAEIFAATMLAKPGFFAKDDAQSLYTLAPVESTGFTFSFEHQFDPRIRSVKITEVEVRRETGDGRKRLGPGWEILLRDRSNALARMGQQTSVSFPAYRLAHLGFRIEFEREAHDTRVPTLQVMLTPPKLLQFKRYAYEERVMELLRRNGLTIERDADQAAVAAE